MNPLLSLSLVLTVAAGASPAKPVPAKSGAASVDLVAVPGAPPALRSSGLPEIPLPFRTRATQFFNERSADILDVTPDGRKALISTRLGTVSQLHEVDHPLGARVQLTFGDEPVTRARYVPGAPDRLLYLMDVGGGEFYQLYLLERRTGTTRLLTDGKSRHEHLVVSADGRRLAYSGTGRNGKDSDVHIAELSAPEQARRVTEDPGTWYPLDFSADGRRLLVMQFRAIDDADLHVVHLDTGKRERVTPEGKKGGIVLAQFDPSGQAVYLSTDRHGDFAQLRRAEVGVPDREPRLLASLPWNVEAFDVSADGKRIVLVVNEDGLSKVSVLDRSGAPRPLQTPRGVVRSIVMPRANRDVVFVALQSAREPSDVYRVDLRTNKWERWTRSEIGGLDPARFIEPQLVRYPSTEGVQVPAFLYQPKPREGRRSPVVVIFHGGPEAQTRPTFSPLVQLLASELNIAVLMPNVRGSDGYGKRYRAMDDGILREASLADIGATLDFVASRPELDPARVAVSGGSYGGYMSLAAATFYPERIRATVDIVGISNLVSFLENTQAYRRDLRRAEYGDERLPDVRRVLEKISPLNAATRIRSALFVQQGANDPRVPQSEAEQMVRAVREGGRPVWYLLALDEGHGFAKKPNRDFAAVATAHFLETHLEAAAGPPPR